MSADKLLKVAKEAGECFSTATTVTLFLFSALGVIVSIPLTVVFPVAGVIGLIFGLVGARRALKQYLEEKAEKRRIMRERQLGDEAGHNISVLSLKLQHDLREAEVNHPVTSSKRVELEEDKDCFDDRMPMLEEKHAYHTQPRFFTPQKSANDPQIVKEEKKASVLSL